MQGKNKYGPIGKGKKHAMARNKKKKKEKHMKDPCPSKFTYC